MPCKKLYKPSTAKRSEMTSQQYAWVSSLLQARPSLSRSLGSTAESGLNFIRIVIDPAVNPRKIAARVLSDLFITPVFVVNELIASFQPEIVNRDRFQHRVRASRDASKSCRAQKDRPEVPETACACRRPSTI